MNWHFLFALIASVEYCVALMAIGISITKERIGSMFFAAVFASTIGTAALWYAIH